MGFKIGKLNPKYKDGRASDKSCLDCGKLISYRNKRCQSCENKNRGKVEAWWTGNLL